jgi:hypothetical protein
VSEPTALRKCRTCGKTKPLPDFARRDGCRGGRQPDCIECSRARGRERRAANLERELERERRYRQEHREEARQRGRRWARENVATQVEYQRERTAALAARVFAHYGTSCACCGSTGRLTIDHIDGDGREHREALFGSSKRAGREFYLWLISEGFPGGHQALCTPCNTSKGRGARCQLNHVGAEVPKGWIFDRSTREWRPPRRPGIQPRGSKADLDGNKPRAIRSGPGVRRAG